MPLKSCLSACYNLFISKGAGTMRMRTNSEWLDDLRGPDQYQALKAIME
ncbi:MAG: hypothetical protein K8R16_03900 [Anaerolineales bacterium]|nr:hypothetical protein [Anaerolineales bacterium]